MPHFRRTDTMQLVKTVDVPKLLKMKVPIEEMPARKPAGKPVGKPAATSAGKGVAKPKPPTPKLQKPSDASGKNTKPVAVPRPQAPRGASRPAPPSPSPTRLPMPRGVRSGLPVVAPGGTPQDPQRPPILSLHLVQGGIYLLRLHDLAYNAVGIACVKQLPDATNLIVVTPTDTKTFHLGKPGGDRAQAVQQVPSALPARPASRTASATIQEEEDTGEEVETTDEEDEEEIDLEAMASEAGEAGEGEDPMDVAMRLAEQGEDEHDAAVDPTRRRRGQQRQQDVEPGGSICGRCQGQGSIKTPLEGGGFVDGTCPVCQGRKVIRKYGVTPMRRR